MTSRIKIGYFEGTQRVEIDGILINDEIFTKELYDYKIIETEEQTDDLIQWIAENDNKDRLVMLEDLKYLLKIDDDYIFSNINTNEYIAESDNPERFDEICNDLLKLNEKINEETK